MRDWIERYFAEQRSRFPGLSQGVAAELVHLNNAAGTEMPETAIEAMTRYMRSGFCNEGPVFRRLRSSAEIPVAARAATADLVGAAPEEIGFAASTTASIFFISRALARGWGPGDRVLVSEACHEANIAPWIALETQGVTVELIPMRSDTHLDYEWLESNLDRRTRLIAIGASSNVTGTIHDVGRVVRAARQVSALVSVDAAHFVPHRAVNFHELDVDLLFFSIYKCFGPHLGAFCVRRSLCETLAPFGIERPAWERFTAARFEVGTRSFESLVGWLAALEYIDRLGRGYAVAATGAAPVGRRQAFAAAMDAVARWEQALVEHGDRCLRSLPGIELYAQHPSDDAPRLGVFSFNLRGTRPADVASALDRHGIEAAVGHNGGVRTMARVAAAHGGIGVRLSLAHYNTMADIDRAVACLSALTTR